MIGTSEEIFDEFKKTTINVKSYCYCEDQNGQNRPYMEDKHFIDDDILGDGSVGLYSVFDGHGGLDVVTYSANLMPELFKKLYKKDINIKQLFQQIFQEIDDELKKNVQSAEDQGTCCCVVLVIQKYQQLLSFQGDTRAVLCRPSQQQAQRVSTDHKASEPLEQQRIEQMGGVIFKGRVSGQLAVTRAIGDLSLKTEGVINIPDVVSFDIDEEGCYIVVASDGLWDVCQDQEAIDQTRNMKSVIQRSQYLKEYALEKETQDNISVLVLNL